MCRGGSDDQEGGAVYSGGTDSRVVDGPAGTKTEVIMMTNISSTKISPLGGQNTTTITDQPIVFDKCVEIHAPLERQSTTDDKCKETSPTNNPSHECLGDDIEQYRLMRRRKLSSILGDEPNENEPGMPRIISVQGCNNQCS